MKKTSVLVAMMLMGIVAASGAVSAFGRGASEGCNKDSIIIRDNPDAIDAAENGDFESWKIAVIDSLTEENFEEFVQRHNQMLAIRLRQEQRDDIRQAIDSNDYDAWKEAMQKLNASMDLNETVFQNMVDIHNARKDGNFSAAKEMRGEFGPGIGRHWNPDDSKSNSTERGFNSLGEKMGNAFRFFRNRIAG